MKSHQNPSHAHEENVLGDPSESLASTSSDKTDSDESLRHLPLEELPEVLTLREVAQVLRCSKAHVCNIVNGQIAGTRQLPAITLGRRKLVRRPTLLNWLAESEQGARMSSSLEVDAGRRA